MSSKECRAHQLTAQRTLSKMSDKKWKAPRPPSSGSAIDGGVLEKIEKLVALPDPSDELIALSSKGFVSQAVQSWAYYAQVNDHAKFTSSTGTLTKLIRSLVGNADLLDQGVQLIKDILTSYSKTLYRALSSLRASVTNPVIRLLNEIVLFKNGALIDDFMALFDFSLAVLPKLLIPTKTEQSDPSATKVKEHLSIRYCFVRLLLNILQYSAPLVRKDFLNNNSKLTTNWFKFISAVDSESLIELTLTVWDEKILKESSFKKATKLKVFNEWNLTRLLPVYYTQDKDLKQHLNSFILSVATDEKFGIKFAADQSWFVNTSSSTALKVNNKSFKTHNKMLYGVIINLKPWDDDMQLHTTVSILESVPELIAPYLNYVASRGLHEPKLTSYWIAQTLLLSKITNLGVPEDLEEYTGIQSPAKHIATELIVPSVLDRSVLTKCLQSDVFLIRQLSAQLVMDSLNKLNQMLELYDSKQWADAKAELINSVYHQLPDLAAISLCITDSYSKKRENKILLLTLLMIVNGYLAVFSDNFNFATAISKPYMDVIGEKEYSSIDLVLLDNFFQLQEGESSQMKWWHKAGKSNSLFTSLLKIASSNVGSSVESKVTGLLSNLVKQTVIFNYGNVKVDPVTVLVHSLQQLEGEDLSKVWKLIDESVSRCVTTPFKYLDSSNQHNRVSPLVITLFEQWNFVEKDDYTVASKWFLLFLRSLIIIGEPAGDILELAAGIELAIDYRPYLFNQSFEEYTEQLPATGGSFYDILTTSPLVKLNKAGIPISDLDIVGALVRIESIIYTESVSFKKAVLVLSDLFPKIGNYWFTHPGSTEKFSNFKYWGKLFMIVDSEKANYVSQVLVEIFSQLDQFDKTDLSVVVKEKLRSELSEAQEHVISESLWALADDEVRGVLQHNNYTVMASALDQLLSRRLSIESSLFASLFNIKILRPVLAQFVFNDLVVFSDVVQLFEAVTQDHDSLYLLNLLAKNVSQLPELIKFIESGNDEVFISVVASSLNDTLVQGFLNKDLLTALVKRGAAYAIQLIKTEDFSEISFNQLCNIFSNSLAGLDDESKSIAVEHALSIRENKFSPEIAKMFQSIARFEDAGIKTWVNKSVLYLTKIFSEYPEPPSHFFAFLESFKSLILNVDVPSVMSKSHVNALLEVILSKWVQNEIALEFASVVVVTGSRSFLEFGKLLQIVVNHDSNALLTGSSPRAKFFTALLIWRLYEYDASKNASVALQEQILSLYSGSTRPEDFLLLRVLEKLEGKLNSSWIDSVYAWDLSEDDESETRFIVKKREGLVIVLNQKFVENGLRCYNTSRYSLEQLNKSSKENWANVESFYQRVSSNTSSEVSKTVYDPLFLSLLLINNDELVSVTAGEGTDLTVKASMKKLVDSDLFAHVVLNLSSEDSTVVAISKCILSSLLQVLKDETTAFKEKHLFEILVTKLLYTFTREDYEPLAPVVWVLISRMVSIINNPGHMLYEKTFRWVLKNPFVRGNDIPLYLDVVTVTSSEETDVYYKQLSWMLESLTIGVQTAADTQLLRNKNVFELIMNLLNSPYLPQKLRFEILELLSAVQTIEGGDVLITRFGGLSHLEQCRSDISGDSLQHQQELLNLKELAVKYTLLGEKKRVAEWASGDIEGFVKRMVL